MKGFKSGCSKCYAIVVALRKNIAKFKKNVPDQGQINAFFQISSSARPVSENSFILRWLVNESHYYLRLVKHSLLVFAGGELFCESSMKRVPTIGVFLESPSLDSIQMYMYMSTYIYIIYVYVYVNVYIYMYMSMSMSMYIYIYVYVFALYLYMVLYTHVCCFTMVYMIQMDIMIHI